MTLMGTLQRKFTALFVGVTVVPLIGFLIVGIHFLLSQLHETGFSLLSLNHGVGLLIIVGVIMVHGSVLWVAYRYVRRLSQTLQLLIRHLHYLSHGEILDEVICYYRHDEVADMVHCVEQLSANVKVTINQALTVASGDFSHYFPLHSERDQLGFAFNKMTSTLRETSTILQSVAAGDFTREMVLKGPNDYLAIGINQMILTLKEGAELAKSVARGDFSKNMRIKSEHDELSMAMNLMINNFRKVVTQAEMISKGDYTVDFETYGDQDELGNALHHMTEQLREMTIENERQNWIKTGKTELNDVMSRARHVDELAHQVITFLANYLHASIGALYLATKQRRLKRVGHFAYIDAHEPADEFKFGEGLIGQAALQGRRIELTTVPEDYIRVKSGLGESLPKYVIVVPFFINDEVKGVIELAAFKKFTDQKVAFITQVLDSIAIHFHSLQANIRLKILLEQTRKQAQELTLNQDELHQKTVQLQNVNTQLGETNQKLAALSHVDSLTGIANRRAFDELFEQEWRRALRDQVPLSVAMIDIDYFKDYNDVYGHLAGDDCLQQIAHSIAGIAKRPGDIAARYGGEEFVVLLSDTDAEGAYQVAETINSRVVNLNIPHHGHAVDERVTISVGVATLIPTDMNFMDDVVHQADKALYKAKKTGRNRVAV